MTTGCFQVALRRAIGATAKGAMPGARAPGIGGPDMEAPGIAAAAGKGGMPTIPGMAEPDGPPSSAERRSSSGEAGGTAGIAAGAAAGTPGTGAWGVPGDGDIGIPAANVIGISCWAACAGEVPAGDPEPTVNVFLHWGLAHRACRPSAWSLTLYRLPQ
jgi:hypothetical protein